jgi:hypothetical protein
MILVSLFFGSAQFLGFRARLYEHKTASKFYSITETFKRIS